MGREIYLSPKLKERIVRYREFIATEPQDFFVARDYRGWDQYFIPITKVIDTLETISKIGFYTEGSDDQAILNSLERYYQIYLELNPEKK